MLSAGLYRKAHPFKFVVPYTHRGSVTSRPVSNSRWRGRSLLEHDWAQTEAMWSFTAPQTAGCSSCSVHGALQITVGPKQEQCGVLRTGLLSILSGTTLRGRSIRILGFATAMKLSNLGRSREGSMPIKKRLSNSSATGYT